jgi:CMP-N,N'-diacetyllegionaminic acid synthase
MKILAIITARGGSKGVPGKNIKFLGTKQLIQYTIEAALASSLITDIIASTDSESIASVAKASGVAAPFLRPAELATDTASSIDVVIHAINYLENEEKYYDAVCLLQPTCPFRPVDFIDKAITQFEKSEVDSLISVLPVPDEFNPHWIFEPGIDGNLHIVTGEREIIKRRQDLPRTFFRDGSIYITKKKVIKEQHSFYGDRIGYIESDPLFYANIDTPADFANAENKLPTVLPFIACAG